MMMVDPCSWLAFDTFDTYPALTVSLLPSGSDQQFAIENGRL